ncbi:uncharacterized protein EI90DRAFT_3069410 [Cantharellus anzutake]|uniref:uncharacterized protein n=1 Tax=Cantharellus anzutake TaxID=1750568 RepID=UPI0019084688|nr:uncharacterized protein EI90DRAFT_3069410 [Cantharellus anzutake]KAF8326879.1 hypothetical protein EI90DRAFT_3069410 [Cantharellus anzutake]
MTHPGPMFNFSGNQGFDLFDTKTRIAAINTVKKWVLMFLHETDKASAQDRQLKVSASIVITPRLYLFIYPNGSTPILNSPSYSIRKYSPLECNKLVGKLIVHANGTFTTWMNMTLNNCRRTIRFLRPLARSKLNSEARTSRLSLSTHHD